DIDCYYIKHIDNLWEYYSDGKFSLRIQNSIYNDIKNRIEDNSNPRILISKFGQEVGWYDVKNTTWKSNEELDYSLDAPDGHLPTRTPVTGPLSIGQLTLENGWIFISVYESSLLETCLAPEAESASP
ncbi:MAG: GUN4 domain-containing protein, partial [Cyanobacteria bacterium P01_F01_bin.86]